MYSFTLAEQVPQHLLELVVLVVPVLMVPMVLIVLVVMVLMVLVLVVLVLVVLVLASLLQTKFPENLVDNHPNPLSNTKRNPL